MISLNQWRSKTNYALCLLEMILERLQAAKQPGAKPHTHHTHTIWWIYFSVWLSRDWPCVSSSVRTDPGGEGWETIKLNLRRVFEMQLWNIHMVMVIWQLSKQREMFLAGNFARPGHWWANFLGGKGFCAARVYPIDFRQFWKKKEFLSSNLALLVIVGFQADRRIV